MRVLLFETTRHYPASPFFVSALEVLAREQPGKYESSVFDQAPFARSRRSLALRIMRRLAGVKPVRTVDLNRQLLEHAITFAPDLFIVDKGAWISPLTLERIKRHTGAVLVNYATDDPFNRRVSTPELVQSIPLYDLFVSTKRAIMGDLRAAGARNVVFVPFAYKPEVHFPEQPATLDERERFNADVAFVGGCDSDRTPYFRALITELPDVRLALYGGSWNRSPVLRRHWRGYARGRNFRLAVCGAKINVNLVRRANRDGHVMRSFELPACGAFMLAERTDEHREFFEEGREMACFLTPEELAQKVRYYLTNEDARTAIATAGYRRVRGEPHTYYDRLTHIIKIAAGILHP